MNADEQDVLISNAARDVIALAARAAALVAMFAMRRPVGTQSDAPAKTVDWYAVNGFVFAFDDVRDRLLEAARLGIEVRTGHVVETGAAVRPRGSKPPARRPKSRR